MNDTKNKNMLCNTIAVLGLFVIIDILIEPMIGIWGKVSVASVIIGMFGLSIVLIPLIILVVFAFKKTPERFNFYVILGLISYVGTAFFSVVSIIMKASGALEKFEFAARTTLFNLSWKDLATGSLMTACYFILINAMQKQRKGENAYTKKYVICEFILLGLSTIITFATKDYTDLTVLRITWVVLLSLANRVIEACLILAVKYIEKKEDSADIINSQPTENTIE